ncbi:MAG: hypothetical protein IJW08_05370 [Lentisphaeria bacterium]|nr:hypothetical protein [Lentisphaeria bacterium]
MPEIPKSNLHLLDHVNAGVPLSNHQVRYYGGDGTAGALGNFRKGMEQLTFAAAREYQRQSAVAEEFRKKYEDTENRLAATEARNLYSQINSEVDLRMTENPGLFNEFADWAKDADSRFSEEVKPFLERMTPDFRKQFEADFEGIRNSTFEKRKKIGMHAKITADYTRFQELFKHFAPTDMGAALELLDNFRGTLISEQEYLTKRDVDLPRLFQSAQARRDIDAGKENIISQLEAVDEQGSYINYPAMTPEHRTTLVRYARAKDEQKRAEENARIYELLAGGMEYTADIVEKNFEGKTSPEDLNQKNQQLQMIDRFQSAKKRAQTAAQKKHYDDQFNSDLYSIITMEFPVNNEDAAIVYSRTKKDIFSRYAGDGQSVNRLLSQLDSVYAARPRPAAAGGKEPAETGGSSYKNSPVYQAATAKIKDAKQNGRLSAAVKSWWGTDDAEDDSAGTVTYIEKLLTIDVDDFIQQNPQAKFPEIDKYIDERITYYNKRTVEDIANMVQHQNATDRRTGKFNGKDVVFKNGKWEYAK